MISLEVEPVDSPSSADQLWVYLADWALLVDETEILASDFSDTRFTQCRDAMVKLVGSMVRRVHFLEDNEIHIDFSGQMRLEIWPNHDTYGRDQTLMMLFGDGKHLHTLVG